MVLGLELCGDGFEGFDAGEEEPPAPLIWFARLDSHPSFPLYAPGQEVLPSIPVFWVQKRPAH